MKQEHPVSKEHSAWLAWAEHDAQITNQAYADFRRRNHSTLSSELLFTKGREYAEKIASENEESKRIYDAWQQIAKNENK